MKALYTIFDKNERSVYLSEFAGGFSYPFYIYNYARSMAQKLNEQSPVGEFSPSEMFPLMKAGHNFPEEYRGQKIFQPLSDEDYDKLSDDMFERGTIPIAFILDYDKKNIWFEFPFENSQFGEMKDFCVSADGFRFSGDERTKLSPNMPEWEYEEQIYRAAAEKFCFLLKSKNSPVMDVSIKYRGKEINVSLPMSAESHAELHKAGIMDFEDIRAEIVSVFDKRLEAIKEISDASLTELNSIADLLHKRIMDTEFIKTFASVLESDNVTEVRRAFFIADHIDEYTVIPAMGNEEYGKYILYTNPPADIENDFEGAVYDYIDFEQFGYDRVQLDEAILTRNGFVIRTDMVAQLEEEKFPTENYDLKM